MHTLFASFLFFSPSTTPIEEPSAQEVQATSTFMKALREVYSRYLTSGTVEPRICIGRLCISCGLSGSGDRKPGAPYCHGTIAGTGCSCGGVCNSEGCVGDCGCD